MTTNIYVDGSGGTKSGYGFFVKETNKIPDVIDIGDVIT